MTMKQIYYNTIDRLKKVIDTFVVLSAIFECILFPAWENAFGCVTMLYGWFLISRYVLKHENLAKHFIPFIMIFCYAVYFFALPLAATMVENKPITFRFNVPYLTFFNLMINATVIVFAFLVCKKIYKQGTLTLIWKKLGYFTPPSEKQIWILGLIGLLSLAYGISFMGTDEARIENKGVFGQFVSTLSMFAYTPIVLLFSKYYGGNVKNIPYKKLILFFSIVIFLGIITTKRSIILNAGITAVVMYFFCVLIENRRLMTPKTSCITIVCLYLLTGPLSDMAMAMILSRQMTKSENSETVMNNVWKLYSDKELLHTAYNMATLSNTDNRGNNYAQWSEYYLDNIFLDRFCNLRTQDISMDYATKLGYNNPVMHEYAKNQFIYLVPTPILNIFGYTGNKFDYFYQPGDVLSTEALGLKEQYRGLRVAGTTAIGLYWLGYGYYILAFFVYILVFCFLSSIVVYRPILIIPVPVIIALFDYVKYFNNCIGIFRSFDLLLRTGWQDIIVYCAVLWLIRKFVT